MGQILRLPRRGESEAVSEDVCERPTEYLFSNEVCIFKTYTETIALTQNKVASGT